MIIDTHAHLYLPEFQEDGQGANAVERALDAGVDHMIFPNVDLSTIEPMKRLHEQFPTATSMAMGLHPTEINDTSDEALATVIDELRRRTDDYVAIGEIGIDLYWDATWRDRQMQALETQCRLAVELDKPVIIHCREGLDETLEVLSGVKGIRGVMHSFGGTKEDVDRVRRVADMYFGINGIVTFKNSKLSHVLPAIGTDRLLLETDAPYLAPVPHRGKRNERAFIVHTAAYVAHSLDKSVEEISDVTTRNARTLFGI